MDTKRIKQILDAASVAFYGYKPFSMTAFLADLDEKTRTMWLDRFKGGHQNQPYRNVKKEEGDLSLVLFVLGMVCAEALENE